MSERNIVRTIKSKNYTVMSNVHLRDENLSWKAKGIHSYILSLPDDWKIIINHLITVSTDREKSTRSGLKELYDNRYWQKYPVYIDGKVDHWVTLISEIPFKEEEIIKSIVYRDGVEVINYRIDDEKLSTESVDKTKKQKSSKKAEKSSDLLPQKGKVDESVEITDVELLSQKVEVGMVDVDMEGLLNTNTTKDLLVTKDLVSQSQKEDKEETDKTDDLFAQIIKQSEINNYTFDEDKELFIAAIDRLLKLEFLNINGYVLSGREIREKLLQLRFGMCEIALDKFRFALREKEIKNKLRYFCAILINAIDEYSAEGYFVEHSDEDDWMK